MLLLLYRTILSRFNLPTHIFSDATLSFDHNPHNVSEAMPNTILFRQSYSFLLTMLFAGQPVVAQPSVGGNASISTRQQKELSPTTPTKKVPQELNIHAFIRQPDRRPMSNVAAALRGSCQKQQGLPLMLIAPPNVLAFTFSARPIFLWNMPALEVDSPEVRFQLSEIGTETTRTVYEARLQDLPRQGGLIKMQLPEGAPALTMNQSYQWSVTVVCNPDDLTGTLYANAEILRVEPKDGLLKTFLSTSTHKNTLIYAAAGYWHETLASLATLIQNDPENKEAKANWKQLLEIAGFGQIANQPLFELLPKNLLPIRE
jgi:Domain of Unknown Function (DUF928)